MSVTLTPKETVQVPVGPTTVVGWGASAAGLVATVLVAVLNVDQEEALLIASAALTIVSFVVTQVGRYLQARELAKKTLTPVPDEAVSLELDGKEVVEASTLYRASDGEFEGEMAREPDYDPPDSEGVNEHERRELEEAV